MNDEFFEWLNQCPTQWTLTKEDNDGNRSYWFYDNEEVEENED